MTNDEAIEIIECGEISNRWGKDGEEVEKMAIKALEQKPSISEDGTLTVNVEDGSKVSRVLVCGDNHFGGLYYPEQEPCDKCVYSTSEGCQYDDITETIPPFETSDDAISRQAVLKIIDGWYDNNRDTENIEDLIVLITYMGSVNPQKPICPSAGIDCEDCPAYEDAISRYQKIKQMLYEFKEMPLAPCLMKGHICAVHEILNEVIEPSASSSEKPKSECEHDHEILKAYSDGASEVLDKVRDEISERSRMHMDGDLYIKTSDCMQIIDEFTAEEDKA